MRLDFSELSFGRRSAVTADDGVQELLGFVRKRMHTRVRILRELFGQSGCQLVRIAPLLGAARPPRSFRRQSQRAPHIGAGVRSEPAGVALGLADGAEHRGVRAADALLGATGRGGRLDLGLLRVPLLGVRAVQLHRGLPDVPVELVDGAAHRLPQHPQLLLPHAMFALRHLGLLGGVQQCAVRGVQLVGGARPLLGTGAAVRRAASSWLTTRLNRTTPAATRSTPATSAGIAR